MKKFLVEEWIVFCVESKDASYLTDDGYIGKKGKGLQKCVVKCKI